jgi:hypothetical protein
LKYFAQWLSEDPRLDSLEAYLAEQIHKNTSRAVSPEDIQHLLCGNPCLMVFDGLDEVLEPTLRHRMLARLSEFLGRADQLGADLQVLATSRPTGYNDQFDPERFLHLNLLPLSPDRVNFYARRWTRNKVPLEEERERILETLAECQRDEQVRLLLATPLQVTIVLLVIKDGGRPPRQREALFNEYWGTIFRREKAKAKWIIRSEEPLLFDLHTYLAYLLHRRAASEDIISLLPEAEFSKAVRNFLRQNDTLSPEESINQQAMQLVSEARDRLVLLVEPQSGLFGFELRPLQEFFAAVYLAQTARDTAQRFERFKALARLDHWHNAGLFFAGRIVRTFTGEAANVLELVCRPVDRELPDRYLRRGAWLALDIAADGAFAANRDLQYNAVEYGLSVLGSGLTTGQREHLQTALRQLPAEDQRDILRPVLKEQLRALPPSGLETALDACGEFLKSEPMLQDSLQSCIATEKSVDVLTALDLAVQYRADPDWLARQLQRYWLMWGEANGGQRLARWWNQAPEYVRSVLRAWSPSDEQIHKLLDGILARPWYGPPERISSPDFLFGEPLSSLDQTIATLECWSILQVHWRYGPGPNGEGVDFGEAGGIRLVKPSEAREQFQATLERFASITHLRGQIQALLQRPDLLPHLRASLWVLYWALNTSTAETAAAFLKDVEDIAKTMSWERGFRRFWVREWWPLLAVALERLESGDRQGVERLLPFLDGATQLDISDQVGTALHDFVRRESKEQHMELWESLRLGKKVNLPELAPLAENMGIQVEELVQMHMSWWIKGGVELSSAFLQGAFVEIEGRLSDPEELAAPLWVVSGEAWATDPEVLAHGRHLLSTLLERWDEYPTYAKQGIVNLFLTLLAYAPSTLEEAPRLLTVLAGAQDAEEWPLWPIRRYPEPIVQADHLVGLTGFVNHLDKAIREGASVLWEALIGTLLSSRPWRPVGEELRTMHLHLDWQAGWTLISAQDRARRQRGITLLTLSDFPIEDEARRMELLDAMAACQAMDESEAWARLIQHIPIAEAQEAQWQQLLEAILSQPQRYTQAILAAAMERYTDLAGQIGPDIPADETSLGLPPAT